MFKTISLLSFLLHLASCASVNSVALTPIPKDRSREVRAEVRKTVILALSFDNDFIEPLTAQLRAKCPDGLVTGILTKDEVYSYIIAHEHRITATGYCVRSPAEHKEKVASLNSVKGLSRESL